jgi:membrane protein implicated in regulation of membrane protease activity
MGIGTGVFLLAVGAILAFAVDADVSGIELSTVGWILMAAGALAIILFLTVWAPRRRIADRGDVVQERRVYDDRRYDDGPPVP